MPEKVVIIGSGPAGWSAAIYAARANLDPLVFEGTVKPEMIPLGQLAFTTEVENYPGFPFGNVRAFIESAVDKDRHWNLPPAPDHKRDGVYHYAVQGVELMELMKQQALNFDTRVIGDDIVDIDVSSRPYKVIPASGDPVETHTIIVATGARANYLGLPSEEEYKNKGVSACAVCDGALPIYRSKPLAVVGGGDSAVEEATYLTKFASKVYMIHRRDELRASKIMADRALNNKKIEMVWDSEVTDVIGDDVITGVKIQNNKTNEDSELAVNGLFIAIGHTPITGFLNGQLDTDDKGYLILEDLYRSTTKIEGCFAAGDVVDSTYRQAITAAGMGCKASIDAERWLADQGIE